MEDILDEYYQGEWWRPQYFSLPVSGRKEKDNMLGSAGLDKTDVQLDGEQ